MPAIITTFAVKKKKDNLGSYVASSSGYFVKSEQAIIFTDMSTETLSSYGVFSSLLVFRRNSGLPAFHLIQVLGMILNSS